MPSTSRRAKRLSGGNAPWPSRSSSNSSSDRGQQRKPNYFTWSCISQKPATISDRARFLPSASAKSCANTTSNNACMQRMDCTEGIPEDFRTPKPLPRLDERRFVTGLISNNPVVIFSKSRCPHCKDTKSLLAEKGVKYTTVELDTMKEGPTVQNVLQEMTNARTVPRIFIGGQCVGGNSDLKLLNANGRLEDILREVN